MLVKHCAECPQVIANDGSRLRELLRPDTDALELPYSLALAELAPGQRSLKHRLAQNEVYHLITGAGRMHVDGENELVVAGDVIFVPAGAAQWIENPSAMVLSFAVIVSPPWRAHDDELLA